MLQNRGDGVALHTLARFVGGDDAILPVLAALLVVQGGLGRLGRYSLPGSLRL